MISKRIDKLVEWTKWPAAGIAVVSIPMTLHAWGHLLYRAQSFPGYLVTFMAGIVLFALLARTQLARSGLAARFIEFERDTTQSILAMLMLHPVVGFGKNQTNKGSRVRWLGRGNWVMLAAPYFIPTATIILWFVSLILFQTLRCLILGFGISYHMAALVVQWHAGTSELRRLGRRFCWMFLPAANLAVAGCAMAFALNGFTGVSDFLYDWIRLPQWILTFAWPSVG
ncbi:MAG: hypothetical protein ABL921_01525 [Pirellula sp.]